MTSLQSEISALVSKFSSELEALVRSAAVEAVQGVLGGSSSTARALPAASAPKRGGRKPGTKAASKPVTNAASPPAPKAPRAGKRLRRTAEDIAKLGQSIADYVAKNPGSSAEQIKAALKIPGNQWGLSIGWALDANKLSRRGEKRAAVYSPAGGAAIAKPAPVPPIKRAK